MVCQSLPECQRHWQMPWVTRAPPSLQSLVVSWAGPGAVLLWSTRLSTAGATDSSSARVGCQQPGAVPGQSVPVCSHGRSAQVSSPKTVTGTCGSIGRVQGEIQEEIIVCVTQHTPSPPSLTISGSGKTQGSKVGPPVCFPPPRGAAALPAALCPPQVPAVG